MSGRGRHKLNPRVLGLAALFAIGAVTACTLWPAGRPALSSHNDLPWWMLAAGFALCEVFVIHLDRGTQTHSFSLMEVPLVMGFFLVSPGGLVLARVAGSGLALAIHRRQSLQKLTFNLSLFSLETSLAALTFRHLVPPHAGVGPASWGYALLACLLANVVGAGGVSAVIAVAGGGLQRTTLRRMVVEGIVIGPLANTSLALVAAVVLWYEPAAAALLVSLTLILVLAYRGYSSLSRRYANLQRLYAFTRETHRSVDENDAVVSMLQAARRLLNADTAELIVTADSAMRSAVRTRVTAGSAPGVEGPFDAGELGPLWDARDTAADGIVIPRTTTDPVHRAVLDSMGWRDCLLASFQQDAGVVGIIVLADCSGDVNTFDREDLALFAALVNHAVVSLENSRLVSRLQHEALHDGLTGLPNRTLFNRCVQTAIGNRRPGDKVAVLLFDLDRFKDVNDTLGHHHGDQLLVDVGRRLEQAAPAGTVVARLGGDEFAVLLPPTDDHGLPMTHARALAAALDAPFELDRIAVASRASIGIAICPDHGEVASTLLQRSDVAMYVSKSSGMIELYSPDRDNHSTRRLALVSELRTALDEHALEVWYQPKADAASRSITGAEALIRWNHRERGWVGPDEFIPVAEQTGLIVPLTEQVLADVAQRWRAWHDAGIELRLAANLSLRSLQDPSVVDEIRDCIDAVGMPPSALTLEITESSIMSDPTRTLRVLHGLASTGISLAVDDFGTGYSSLTYLRQLPVQEIKIDKSFVIGMDRNPGDAAIVRSVIDLGRNLGLNVVAEGVETEAAWEQLAAWGCDTIQGYHLSRPAPPDKLTEWLATMPAARRHSVSPSPALT